MPVYVAALVDCEYACAHLWAAHVEVPQNTHHFRTPWPVPNWHVDAACRMRGALREVEQGPPHAALNGMPVGIPITACLRRFVLMLLARLLAEASANCLLPA